MRWRVITPLLLTAGTGLLIFAFPEFAHAAFPTIQPIAVSQCNCTSSAPDFGCLLQIMQVVLNDLVAIGTIIVILFIVWAGVSFIASRTNVAMRVKARQRLINAVIGLFIIVAAWLLVGSFLSIIYNANAKSPDGQVSLGQWDAILSSTSDCIAQKPNGPTLPGLGGSTPSGSITPAQTQPQQPAPAPSTTPSSQCGASSGLNCPEAIAWLEANHKNPPYVGANKLGQCAKWIREALAAGGLSYFQNGLSINAYQYGSVLQSQHFNQVYQGTYSSASQSAFAYQAGDIVVFQPVSGHPNGHIAMWTGSQWISDFAQNNMDPTKNGAYQGGSFAIYRP